jgi:mono/diheme cytochrome c family protein
MGKGSANLNDPEWQEKTTIEEIIEVTTEGKGKMPKYKEKLSAEQTKLIAEYIMTLK